MKFTFANCKVCGQYVFNASELVAFKRTKPLIQVNLKGEQPWCGMLCICLQCISAIKKATS